MKYPTPLVSVFGSLIPNVCSIFVNRFIYVLFTLTVLQQMKFTVENMTIHEQIIISYNI